MINMVDKQVELIILIMDTLALILILIIIEQSMAQVLAQVKIAVLFLVHFKEVEFQE